jgi:ATP-dependent Clp protease adaptor protein ClpS
VSHETSSSTLTDSRSEQKLERPRMWRVLLHNDDYTTQEFVVWVLEAVFRKPRAEAVEVMMHVHLSGIGIAGIYTHDVAETKLRKTRQMAEEQEFPLLVTMEPDAGPEHE